MLPCLSPVSTQILMFANIKFAIVWGTPSCSLSSIAVTPISIMSRSISSYIASRSSSLFSNDTAASWCRFFQSLKKSSSRSREARQRVRKPSPANFYK